ncbi:MAG: hypothetical protein J7647_01650 [Cyanobacteria bacterium SBLK]|nr:hypothetical protein [Cyanobacteria bacterium SBLK]
MTKKVHFDDALEQKLGQMEKLRNEMASLCLWGMIENGVSVKDFLSTLYAHLSPSSGGYELLQQLIEVLEFESLDYLKESFLRTSVHDFSKVVSKESIEDS